MLINLNYDLRYTDIAKDRYIDGIHKSGAKLQIIFRICKYLNKKNQTKCIYTVYI